MKRLFATATLLLASALLVAPRLAAQASDLPSAAPPAVAGQSDTQRGRLLLDQMIAALGGQAWLDRTTIQFDGRTSAFFHGEPNPFVAEFHEQRRLPASGLPEAERVGFFTARSMVLPGKVIDVVQIWSDGRGTEITYKGQTALPKEQVEDHYRRQAHSIGQVVRTWIHAPGVMIVAEGSTLVERHRADQVTILSADNDAVTLDLDAVTHLPLRSTFRWRNSQFNDSDEDAEEYDDYHPIQGLPTPMTITRYHNGEMVSQRYLTRIVYNQPLDASLFDPTLALKKK